MKFKSWRDLPEGAIIKDVPTSPAFKTGEWRIKRPFFYPERCKHDLLCWLYCPDSAVVVKNGRVVDFDMEYCKGCGICVKVCPHEALEMKEEEV